MLNNYSVEYLRNLLWLKLLSTVLEYLKVSKFCKLLENYSGEKIKWKQDWVVNVHKTTQSTQLLYFRSASVLGCWSKCSYFVVILVMCTQHPCSGLEGLKDNVLMTQFKLVRVICGQKLKKFRSDFLSQKSE